MSDAERLFADTIAMAEREDGFWLEPLDHLKTAVQEAFDSREAALRASTHGEEQLVRAARVMYEAYKAFRMEHDPDCKSDVAFSILPSVRYMDAALALYPSGHGRCHSSVRADDHEVGQPSPEDVERARAIVRQLFDVTGDKWEWGYSGPVQFTVDWIAAPIAAALSAARAERERAGLERAAQWCEAERGRHGSLHTGNILTDAAANIRALLPPSTPETKP